MNSAAEITIDVLAIISLCFTIALAKKNAVINEFKNKIYINISLLTIILLVLEIMTVTFQFSTNHIFVIPHTIANILGFSLCPLVPFSMFIFNYDSKKYLRYFSIPLYINAIICILSWKTGWIFSVNSENYYTRGEIFLLPLIVSTFYLILLINSVSKNKKEYDRQEKIFLAFIFIMLIVAITFQILFKDILLIWGSAALSLLSYYIFLRELQFKYDPVTGIENRSAFEKEIVKYQNSNKKVAIVVLDLNNLKVINDEYGHRSGDKAIIHASQGIQQCFSHLGRAFRIGGDEFCVICDDISSEHIESALLCLDSYLEKPIQHNIKVVLAYGYSIYIESEGKSIYHTFSQADKSMYIHKAKLKGMS